MVEFYRAGKFKKLGLSNFSAFEVVEIVTMCNERGWVRPTIYQAVYNARGIENELVPCCRRYGIDIDIFNPSSSSLENRNPQKFPWTCTGVTGTSGRETRSYLDRGGIALTIVEKDGNITGFSSFGQLENNLDNLEKGPLPDELVQALNQVWYMAKADAGNFWHGKLEYQYDTQKALFGK
ncbi:Aldo/keto reductase [Penicillium citrinum]|uniref:Aldo/keto reductase n=1 Tax=Penicillium citrinum TaxID=5077 RepID=A0A9W9PCX2_PENCI|nr:Aldo/keto reductase [Penicillium citrinum]KAJ5242222.1 Aldo/keto reductase [Penicillium citrinum]